MGDEKGVIPRSRYSTIEGVTAFLLSGFILINSESLAKAAAAERGVISQWLKIARAGFIIKGLKKRQGE